MKHNLRFYLLAALISMVSIAVSAHDFEVDGIYYKYNNGRLGSSVSVTFNGSSSTSKAYSGEVIIPESVVYNGKTYSVTSIGDNAFYGCTGLASVDIPNSVTAIAGQAFNGCSGLTSVTIPNSVTSIGDGVFSGCSSLASVTILNDVTAIGSEAFYNTAWYNNQLDGLVYIGKVAYKYKGTMPTNTSIVIEEGTVSISPKAFINCSSLTSVTIPNSVTSIGSRAFINCSGLTSMTIPNSVTSIGSSAFWGCSGLITVTIPNSVTSIGRDAFNGTAWFDNQPDGLVYAGIVAYLYKGNMPGNTSIIIKDGTASISTYAFYKCSGLTSVTIPNSVTSIGDYAFYGCSLTSVNIPNSVTSIGSGAFSGCSGLTSVVIPNGVTSIGGNAFSSCSGLTSVTIPNSVTAICGGAFQFCSGLTSVNIPISVTSIGDRAFDSCSGLTSVTIGNGVTVIGDYAFYGCSGLTSVNIPNNVIDIGEHAFAACSGLKTVIIGNGVTFWGEGLFSECKNLISIIFRDGLSTIGKQAFFDCSGLTSVNIPNSVTAIGSGAFSSCSGLTSVVIPNGVTSIGGYAFSSCSGLTTVSIPNSVTTIGLQAFYNCSVLTSVTVGTKVPITIQNYTFTNSANATLYVPKGSKAAYQAANYWKEFKAIIEYKNKQTLELSELPTMTYGDEAYTLPPFTTEGLTLTWSIGDETVADISGNILTILKAGTTTVTATQAGNDDYAAFEREFTLTVGKAMLTVTANNCTKRVGDDNPELNVNYEGFMYTDDATSLATQPIVATTATKESPAGVYPITVSGAASGNYNFTYVEGTLTVTEKPISPIIIFADATVKSICVDNWDTDGDGELSEDEAAAVTDLDGNFEETAISSFNELRYFTGLTAFDKTEFSECSSLISVSIPSSVTTYGKYSFDCENLVSVTVGKEEPVTISSGTFSNRTNATLYVPKGCMDAYRAAPYWQDFYAIEETVVPVESADITISSVGVGTYCSEYDLDFTDVSGIKAYIACGFNPTTGTVFIMHVDEVPANTGIMVKGDPGTYTIPVKDTEMYYVNMLKGTLVSMTVPATEDGYQNYVLRKGDLGPDPLFYVSHGSSTLAANRAYLQIPLSVAGARKFVELCEDDVMGIVDTEYQSREDNAEVYNLNGQRVTTQKKGLYIMNGKKVFIR